MTGLKLALLRIFFSFKISLLLIAASSLATPSTLKQSPLLGVRSKSITKSDFFEFPNFSIDSTSSPNLVSSASNCLTFNFASTFSKR